MSPFSLDVCFIFTQIRSTMLDGGGTIYLELFLLLTSNGIWKGAVPSPFLFCVEINKLISQLHRSDIGYQLGVIYLGIWIYADAIVLLSQSCPGLQSMTTILETFAKTKNQN